MKILRKGEQLINLPFPFTISLKKYNLIIEHQVICLLHSSIPALNDIESVDPIP